MKYSIPELVDVPAHVPNDRVYDFDFTHPPCMEDDVHLAWLRVRDETPPDLFWTPRNGGHWVATRGAPIKELQLDHLHFSHRHFSLPVYPGSGNFSVLMGNDPPKHTDYRKIIMPNFLPKYVEELEKFARRVAIERIEEIIDRGECEFSYEFARYVPAAVVMNLFGLPISDLPMLFPMADALVRPHSIAERKETVLSMDEYLRPWIEERRRRPGDDLLSHIVKSRIGERALTEPEMLSLGHVLFAGLDTVGSMMGFFARFLAMHPSHRREIVDHPEIRRNAVEELIRRHGITNTVRYVVNDMDFYGAALKSGDIIMVPNLYYGLDDRIVDSPLDVNFHRDQFPLAAFGNGPHICPGNILARRELAIFLTEWLTRIPDFQIKPGTTPEVHCGNVIGMMKLELVWDPSGAPRN